MPPIFGELVLYEWSFGDGTVPAAGNPATHVFSKEKLHVTLKVRPLWELTISRD